MQKKDRRVASFLESRSRDVDEGALSFHTIRASSLASGRPFGCLLSHGVHGGGEASPRRAMELVVELGGQHDGHGADVLGNACRRRLRRIKQLTEPVLGFSCGDLLHGRYSRNIFSLWAMRVLCLQAERGLLSGGALGG